MLKKYVGDRAFYRAAMAVAVPIMIQNFITNFVNMLDNVMVGQVGTAQMSGVSIVNQLIFVFNLCLFGAASGAGIFTAQFAGSKDWEGVRHTFRFKLIAALGLTALGTVIFTGFGDRLITLYLRGEGSAEDAARFLSYGLSYLAIMLWGLLPFALSNVYSGTMRENGETLVPMAAGIAAVLVNLVLNYVLIFGKFGAPVLGINGAAIATVISRWVELAISAGYTHTHAKKLPYVKGLYSSLKIPVGLAKRITVKGMPLLFNEALWSIGIAFMNQSYSMRGLAVVAATNIMNTLNHTMSIALMALGNAVGIIVGQKLGAGEREEKVLDTTRKLIAFSLALTLGFAILEILLSGIFPGFYNTTEEVRSLASRLIVIVSLLMPARAFTNAAYFTLRSGGKTLVTFLFDSCFVWAVCVPLAFCLSRFTDVGIVAMFTAVECTELLKCVLGYIMLRRKTWIQNIVA